MVNRHHRWAQWEPPTSASHPVLSPPRSPSVRGLFRRQWLAIFSYTGSETFCLMQSVVRRTRSTAGRRPCDSPSTASIHVCTRYLPRRTCIGMALDRIGVEGATRSTIATYQLIKLARTSTWMTMTAAKTPTMGQG